MGLEMQVARTRDKVDKAKNTLSSMKRTASCSHGWLRLMVQCIFGTITIVSFNLILYMAISSNNNKIQSPSRICNIHSCRVICYNPSFFDSYIDVIHTIKEADLTCDQISVTLYQPLFENSTISVNWLSNLRSNVNELEIIGGNMMRIAPNAFMLQFSANIQRIYFETVTIIDLVPEALIGLTNLKEIGIKNCYISVINNNALEAVDDTLKSLSITGSGYWNPTNLTGQTRMEILSTVYFSYNNFNDILDRNSFSGLKKVRVLYLNSCRISAIGEGTFDYLDEIEMLFLNNNFLVTIPHNLFSKLLNLSNPRPRINLQDNFWYCACDILELESISNSGLLILEPFCYYPTLVNGQTFSNFFGACNSTMRSLVSAGRNLNTVEAILLNGTCSDKNGSPVILISSVSVLSCSSIQQEVIRMSYLRFLNTSSVSEKSSKNEFLEVRFALQSDSISMLEITSSVSTTNGNYGVLWYQTAHPHELYCINTLPDYLRVYNIISEAEYTFCPINLDTGMVVSKGCLSHNKESRAEVIKILILSYVSTTIVCIAIGACIVYTVVRKFPHLLKGNDRILFVKHKNVDALVLPPKVPLRETILKSDEMNKAIFTLTDNKARRDCFVRTKSIRSIAPSYISAMQPTEEQLTEWRLRHHFDNDVTITSAGFNSLYSPLSDNEPMYCSIQANSNPYESLK